ncbi:MAG: DUF952 domain-containing protein [Ilumatobacteraceae bacterium]
MGDVVFHLALAGDWAAAQAAGEYRISTRGRTLEQEGFVHASRLDQTAGVAGRYFAGAGPLVRLYVDRSRVTAPVVDDPVPAQNDVYPHVYGPLNLDAVIATSPTDPEAAADPAWAASPVPLVVGVTGHRHLLDRADVEDRVASVVRTIAARAEPDGWQVVSALAEGADRIVTAAALAEGAGLDAVLPLEVDDYGRDFTAPGSLDEFHGLLDRAASVSVTGAWPGGERARAYANAGEAMLQRCNVLIALWDEQPARGLGGTAEVVAAALGAGIETIVVPVHRETPA